MIQIGFHNVAELIFQNSLVKSSLPKYKHLFDSWELAQKIPQMKSLGIRSILDFINSITDKDIEKISEIFKFPVEIMKMELNPYKNVVGNVKLIVGLIAVALVVIIALQNTDEQEVNLLWASPKISVTFLVVITIALTVVGQWLLGAVLRRRRKKD